MKRTLYDGESPVKRISRSPMVKTAMVNYHRAKTEFDQNARLRNDLKVGGIGLLVGIILGGLMATLSGSPTSNSGNGTNNLVRDLKGPGWNPIHVFYGKMDKFFGEIPPKWYLKQDKKHTKKESVEWFAQHGQDLAVAKFFNFKKDGYFVDLGSSDAVWDSNTFALEQNFGWKGICIEANPAYWYRLAFRTNCHVVGSVVGHDDFEEVKATLPSDPKKEGLTGGLVGAPFDNKNDKKDTVPRYTASLLTILDKFNAPKVIDFLSLDVEGAEQFILKDFEFHKPYSFKVIAIEEPKGLLKRKLQQFGYKLVVEFDGGETLWAHRTVWFAGKQLLNEKQHEIKKHILDEMPKTMLE